MTTNANYTLTCETSYAVGCTQIQVGVPYTANLDDLGQCNDMIEIEERSFMHNVHGDRNGGPQGPPIEVQNLGAIHVVRFTLVQFDVTIVDKLRKRAQQSTAGTIAQADVGTFMLTTNAVRLTLNTPQTEDIRNYWCAIVREPIRVGYGTKYSEWQFEFECHRAPCGHTLGANKLWDTDVANPS